MVLNSLLEPMRCIINNCGGDAHDIVSKTLEQKDDYGYNAKTETWGNLLKEGVIDPKKVSRTAIENAVSAASMLITTESSIAFKPEVSNYSGQ